LRGSEAAKEKVQKVVGKVFEFSKGRGIKATPEIEEISTLAATQTGPLKETVTNNLLQGSTAAISGKAKRIQEIASEGTAIASPRALAFQNTEMQGTMAKSIATANTEMISTKSLATKIALKRNKKFREDSTRSVGIGFRAARKANQGHTAFNSTEAL